MDYDIVVVGLGPAGATLARTLQGRYRVLAVDRKDGSAPAEGALPARGKCCGGLLATDAQKSLAKFGLTLPRDILVDPQIFAVRTIDLHRERERYYQRFYLNLDRRRFDLWLRSLVPARVDIVDRAYCSGFERAPGGFTFRVTRDGCSRQHSARLVVGADGGGSLVRRRFYPARAVRRYVSIQEWFEQDAQAEPYYASVFDPDITDCYSWTIHKDGLLVVGSALPEADASRRFELLKQRLAGRGYRFGRRVRREGCIVHRPTGPSSFVTGKDGVFLVGEAAGFISPSSLEGISYAMDSGYLLARELNRADGAQAAARRYAAATRPIRLRLIAKQLKTPFMYHPALRAAVMASGLSAIDPA